MDTIRKIKSICAYYDTCSTKCPFYSEEGWSVDVDTSTVNHCYLEEEPCYWFADFIDSQIRFFENNIC